MPVQFVFHPDVSGTRTAETLVFIGRAARLLSPEVRKLVPGSVPVLAWEDMIKRTDPGDTGRIAITHTGNSPRKVVAALLPEACSRHNTPTRAWAIPRLVQGATAKGDANVILVVDEPEHAAAAVMAVARSFPTYAHTSRTAPDRTLHVQILGPNGVVADPARYHLIAEATRKAAHWADMPPNELTTTAFVAAAEAIAASLPGVRVEVIRGEALREAGLGGIWSVGRAAVEPPAMVILDAGPDGARRHAAWVGKGIVYDTGGLSIKAKTSMPGMKYDMSGAAAVLASFEAAVRIGLDHRLTAILCLAENAVGPLATRPDDIITLYSGQTVEVNNTDAEGRLVLGDGVAWVTKHRAVTELIDVATLTGAQSVATGKNHAALYANDDAIEQRAVAVGKHTGDLVYPLPYAPEFFRGEFSSSVADMKNSVKDRENAQSSCAGQFIANHLKGYSGPWLHVDMASLASSGGRATGWGVGLLLGLAGLI